MYVLIILTWMGGYVDGASVVSVEFVSQNSCEAAKAEVLKTAAEWKIGDKLRPFCVSK